MQRTPQQGPKYLWLRLNNHQIMTNHVLTPSHSPPHTILKEIFDIVSPVML